MPFFIPMKTLLILTGHSKGLGRAILDRFLTQKEIRILAISRSGLHLRLEGLEEISMDLGDLNALEKQLPDLFPEEEFQKVILINNAGWIGEVKPTGKLSAEGIQKTMNLNLIAPMVLSNAFVKTYNDHTCPKIILNISSGAAQKPLSGWAEYCSSKAGLAMFSRVAAEDLKDKGFHVFSLAPGIVDTDMQGEIRKAEKGDFPALDRFEAYKSEGQLSSPEEVAEKIWHLVTNPSHYSEVVLDVRNF